MELSSSPEEGVNMPVSTCYAPMHEFSKSKMLSGAGLEAGHSGGPHIEGIIRTSDSEPIVKKAVRYRECLKNHAASMGGYAVDGCGDFMPSGEEGTLEALKCAACNCHRNFHRREVDGETPCYCFSNGRVRKRLAHLALPAPPLPSTPIMFRPSGQMIMPLHSDHTNSSEDQDMQRFLHAGSLAYPSFPHHPSMGEFIPKVAAKRYRTKFTEEQREKMFEFAEKLGWRIQKHDEAAVQQFCSDVGVKRHVLKVWMHNNKHTFGKKLLRLPETFNPVPEST